MVYGQLNGKGNTVGTDFLSCDRLARGSKSFGKLFYCKSQYTARLFQVYGLHVTNRYTP